MCSREHAQSAAQAARAKKLFRATLMWPLILDQASAPGARAKIQTVRRLLQVAVAILGPAKVYFHYCYSYRLLKVYFQCDL